MLVIYFGIFLVKFKSIKGLLLLREQNELTEIKQLLAIISIKKYNNNNPPY
jgi:hypothetical protein